MEILTDESLMPWGKHKGTAMANVPPHYLLWLYVNKKCDKQVRDYIADNLNVLHAEMLKKK